MLIEKEEITFESWSGVRVCYSLTLEIDINCYC